MSVLTYHRCGHVNTSAFCPCAVEDLPKRRDLPPLAGALLDAVRRCARSMEMFGVDYLHDRITPDVAGVMIAYLKPEEQAHVVCAWQLDDFVTSLVACTCDERIECLSKDAATERACHAASHGQWNARPSRRVHEVRP